MAALISSTALLLALHLPATSPQPSTTPGAGDRAADPVAYALLSAAHDARQVMPPGFPGFHCALVLEEGEASWKGKLVYRRAAETEVLFEGLDAERLAWARRQLLNLIGHRRGGDFRDGDGRHPLELVPGDSNDFGRLIRVHDGAGSSYRVRDGKVLEVTRTMDGSTFTISVIDTREADPGKYLANHFVVSYRDTATGAVQRFEGYRDSYARVDGVWLPVVRSVLTVTEEPTPSIRVLRLVDHRRLDEGEAAAAR